MKVTGESSRGQRASPYDIEDTVKVVNVNLILLAIAIVASLVSACSSKPKQQIHHYHFEGKILSVDKDRHEVVVDHKAIPGFMQAMTMSYKVKSEAELSKLKTRPND